jgi:hypothetical protein
MAEETMLGVIVNVKEKGFGKAGYYSMFITDRRLIWGYYLERESTRWLVGFLAQGEMQSRGQPQEGARKNIES